MAISRMHDLQSIAIACGDAIIAGDRRVVDELVHPDAVNREAQHEPPNCRGTGPDAFWGTSQWLRSAFAELREDVHHVIVDGDLVAIHVTMRGRHTGPFAVYAPDGALEYVFAPTQREFAVTQSHWIRIKDGQMIEHWANRDDTEQGKQLGWIPPTPAYLVRCALAKRRLRAR